jgi:hypothetical protein
MPKAPVRGSLGPPVATSPATCIVTSPTEPNDFLEKARLFWQARSDRVLTREDAREIMENLIGFFKVLDEWDRADKKSKGGTRR